MVAERFRPYVIPEETTSSQNSGIGRFIREAREVANFFRLKLKVLAIKNLIPLSVKDGQRLHFWIA